MIKHYGICTSSISAKKYLWSAYYSAGTREALEKEKEKSQVVSAPEVIMWKNKCNDFGIRHPGFEKQAH